MWDTTIIASRRSDGARVIQKTKIIVAVAGFVTLLASAAGAVPLELPANATVQAERTVALGSLRLPTAPWREDGLATVRIEGAVRQEAWRLGGGGITALQILRPLREQLQKAGYDILLECRAANCGGFDFVGAIDVLPPPKMYVDLSGFRFLAARSADGESGVTILVSRSQAAGFVQVSQVGPEGETSVAPAAGSQPLIGIETSDGARAPVERTGASYSLERDGRLVLDDLTFESGAATLGEGPFASLAAVVRYLNDDPERQIVLVGHTDAVGALEGNVTLSRRRAEAVMERLVTRYGVDPEHLSAEGVGYLAPIASNASEAGRTANRRVEAVVPAAR